MTKILNKRGKIKFENKDNEDATLLKIYDSILMDKRGYVVKVPKKKESAVVCFSGGQDSVANAGILLKEFGLNVYPFFINRGQSNYKYEKMSVNYFNRFYKSKFPKLYHNYKEITVMTPGVEYKNLLRKTKRMMNILFCHILNDWSWQFISLPIEIEFGNYFDKDIFIKWSYENNVPLHKARTCVKSFNIECGDCPTCWDRRRGYKEAGVKDPTKYKFPMSEKYPTYYDHEKEEENEKRNRG